MLYCSTKWSIHRCMRKEGLYDTYKFWEFLVNSFWLCVWEIVRKYNLRRHDSSVGRASDWRSEGPWFDPGSRQLLLCAVFQFWLYHIYLCCDLYLGRHIDHSASVALEWSLFYLSVINFLPLYKRNWFWK